MPCYGIALLTADNYQVISAINKGVLFSLSALLYLLPEQFTFKRTNKLHWSPQGYLNTSVPSWTKMSGSCNEGFTSLQLFPWWPNSDLQKFVYLVSLNGRPGEVGMEKKPV